MLELIEGLPGNIVSIAVSGRERDHQDRFKSPWALSSSTAPTDSPMLAAALRNFGAVTRASCQLANGGQAAQTASRTNSSPEARRLRSG